MNGFWDRFFHNLDFMPIILAVLFGLIVAAFAVYYMFTLCPLGVLSFAAFVFGVPALAALLGVKFQ